MNYIFFKLRTIDHKHKFGTPNLKSLNTTWIPRSFIFCKASLSYILFLKIIWWCAIFLEERDICRIGEKKKRKNQAAEGLAKTTRRTPWSGGKARWFQRRRSGLTVCFTVGHIFIGWQHRCRWHQGRCYRPSVVVYLFALSAWALMMFSVHTVLLHAICAQVRLYLCIWNTSHVESRHAGSLLARAKTRASNYR